MGGQVVFGLKAGGLGLACLVSLGLYGVYGRYREIAMVEKVGKG